MEVILVVHLPILQIIHWYRLFCVDNTVDFPRIVLEKGTT